MPPDTSSPSLPPSLIPMFAPPTTTPATRPPLNDPLTVELETPPPSPASASAPGGVAGDSPPPNTDGASRRTSTSTDRRLRPGGDPEKVAQAFGGLLVLLIAGLGSLLRLTRGLELRSPTPRQRDDVAEPLARIACRHLPMDALGPDLLDATTAAAALHTYALDGPLITRPAVDHGDLPDPEEY